MLDRVAARGQTPQAGARRGERPAPKAGSDIPKLIMAKKEAETEEPAELPLPAGVVAPRPEPAGGAATLGSLLRKNRMVRLKGTDKTAALQQMVASAARALNLTASEQVDLSAAVLARDAALSTQLGRGWAAPHVRLNVADEMVLIVGRSKSGIDYGRPELGRVHLIFLFISSPKHHDTYLRVLGQLAASFKDS